MNSSAEAAAPEYVVHPSTKLLKPFYLLAIVLAGVIYWLNNWTEMSSPFLYVLPVIVLLWTMLKHFTRTFTKLVVGPIRLRHESGILSKSSRTMELAKVQDVRVDQSFAQRLMGMGDISIETAGETSRLTMHAIDRPHAVADHILDAAHKLH
jgi:membrane protein YdbS with pleckstrin-like domain